jgi:hypothetical protein
MCKISEGFEDEEDQKLVIIIRDMDVEMID